MLVGGNVGRDRWEVVEGHCDLAAAIVDRFCRNVMFSTRLHISTEESHNVGVECKVEGAIELVPASSCRPKTPTSCVGDHMSDRARQQSTQKEGHSPKRRSRLVCFWIAMCVSACLRRPPAMTWVHLLFASVANHTLCFFPLPTLKHSHSTPEERLRW